MRFGLMYVTLIAAIGCANSNSQPSSPTSGTATFRIAGQQITLSVVPDSCDNVIWRKCIFSPTGKATDFPQFSFSFSRSLSTGLAFQTTPIVLLSGDYLDFSQNSCQKTAGSKYNSYDSTAGIMSVSIAKYEYVHGNTNINFTFNGNLRRTWPTVSLPVTAGSVEVSICDDILSCPSSTLSTAYSDQTPLLRNQVYSGISMNGYQSRCYQFKTGASAAYAIATTGSVNLNLLGINYGYGVTGYSQMGNGTVAGNGTINASALLPNTTYALEIAEGNNVSGSFSLGITP